MRKKYKIKVTKELLKQLKPFWQELEKIRDDYNIKVVGLEEEMAKKLGVIQQYISKIENGYENFSVDTLKRIADVFDRKLVNRVKLMKKSLQKANTEKLGAF